MYEIKVTVTGMMCHNCERHMAEAVEKAFQARKVKADHEKNEVTFVSAELPAEEAVKKCVEDTGYIFGGMESKEKKRLFS